MHASGVSMAEKDKVVVSYHCDTENDSNKVNNRFSADLYLTESYFSFGVLHTCSVSWEKMDVMGLQHDLDKLNQLNISQLTTPNCGCETKLWAA